MASEGHSDGLGGGAEGRRPAAQAREQHTVQSDRLRIFISYARRDMATADRLVAALEAADFDVVIDRRDLPYGEEWQQELADFIRSADTAVWLVSPASVQSRWCNWELGEVQRLNKRLVPVAVEPAAPDALPEALGKIHVLPAEGAFDFDKHLPDLVDALNTDRAWLKDHTRLADRARQWISRERSPALLLRGVALKDAQAWADRKPRAAPAPHDEVLALLLASRRGQGRRQRGAIAASLLTALLAVGLAGIAFWQRGEAVRNETRAEDQARIAEEQRDRAMLTQSRFLADLAREPLQAGDAGTAALLALEALPDERTFARPYAPEAEAVLFDAMMALQESMILAGHTDEVTRVAFTPDDRLVMTASRDGSARLWDSRTGEPLAAIAEQTKFRGIAVFSSDGERVLTDSFESQARIWSVATRQALFTLAGEEGELGGAQFSPDGTRLATVGYMPLPAGNTATLWDGATGKAIAVLAHADYIHSAHFSPDGATLVTVSNDDTAKLWDTTTGAARATLAHSNDVGSAAFSPRGDLVVTCSDKAFVWEVATGKLVATHSGHSDFENFIEAAAFSSDGELIATVARDGTARVWRPLTGEEVAVLEGHGDAIQAALFTPDGKRLVTVSDDWTVRVWDIASGQALVGLVGHHGPVRSVALRSDRRQIATSSADATARLWSAASGMVTVLSGHRDAVIDAAFSDDGKRIITGSSDRTARLWDTESGVETAVLEGHTDTVIAARLSSDGTRAITGSLDDTARLWSTSDAKLIAVLEGHTDDVGRCDFSGDSRRAATLADSGDARLWDALDGRLISELEVRERAIGGLAFSQNDNTVIGWLDDGTFAEWSAEDGALIRTGGRYDGHLRSAAYSPDGALLLQAYDSNYATLLDTATEETLFELRGHADLVFDAGFSPVGHRAVTASRDGTARLWDTESGKTIGVLDSGAGIVFAVSFNHDGTRVLTSDGDGAARIWQVFPTTQRLVEYGKQRVPRCLTREQREEAFLDPEPPAWCIEMEKWPYRGQDWKDWLAFKQAGKEPPLPDTAEWVEWIAANQTQ